MSAWDVGTGGKKPRRTYAVAVLPPDGDDIIVSIHDTEQGCRDDLRTNYDQGGVYDEYGDIVDDLINDGYLVTIQEAVV